MVDGNSDFASDTVSGIARAKKDGGKLGSPEVVGIAEGLSTVFPSLPEDSLVQSATSAFVAKVLMGGYRDNPQLGKAMGWDIVLLIDQRSVLASCEELGVDLEVAQEISRIVPEETLPNLDTIFPADLAWFLNEKVRGDLIALGLDRKVVDKYTR